MNEGAIKLGRWIARHHKGALQEQTAELLGIKQPTLSKWLRGITRPSHEAALRVELRTGIAWTAWWRVPARTGIAQ